MGVISQTTAQQIVDTVKDVSGRNINFINEKGSIIASTDANRIGTFHEIGYKAITTGCTLEVSDDDAFFGTRKGINIPVMHNGNIIAAIGISGDVEEVRRYAYLAQKITSLLLKERDLDSLGSQKRSRQNYIIRSLIHQEPMDHRYFLDTLQENKITESTLCRVVLVQLNSKYNPNNLFMIQNSITQTFDRMESSFYTYNYPNEYILIANDNILRYHMYILKQLVTTYHNILTIGIGNKVKIESIYTSYHCARLSIQASGKNQPLMLYDDLDYDLLLGSISDTLKKQYLDKTIKNLQEADLLVLKTYFETDMSLQKTCEQLYIHKNSLQYKLNRIHEKCGYNPRHFRDAIVLYSAIRLLTQD